ncbi:hypothetical protein Q9L58_006529 [Maublancomyces gigas]|uniref:Uncharacterized protein n=1 Tax=Discina gigas TaxID=1032678 RepID=A0ABR3GG40_9PEZI
MDTTSTDLRVPSEEDAAAAERMKINWAHQPGSTGAQQAKKYHTERLCYSAVSGGFIRETIGSQPDTILIRAPVHIQSYDPDTGKYGILQCDFKAFVHQGVDYNYG